MAPEDVTTKNTHLELFPAAMFGIAASIIPYPEHNQSPRNTYESAMAKQSLGSRLPTYPISPHVRQHLLVSPQAPVVRTRTLDLLKIDERPLGQNCVVAVLSFEGYNIEDAIIMNRSSVERGLARSFFYRLYEGEAKQYLGGMRDTFEVPAAESNIRGYRGEKFYRLLEGDGVVAHESQVDWRRRGHWQDQPAEVHGGVQGVRDQGPLQEGHFSGCQALGDWSRRLDLHD